MTLNPVLTKSFEVGFAIATQRRRATQVAAPIHLDRDGGLRLSAADLDHPRGIHLDRAHADASHGARGLSPNLG